MITFNRTLLGTMVYTVIVVLAAPFPRAPGYSTYLGVRRSRATADAAARFAVLLAGWLLCGLAIFGNRVRDSGML